MYCLTHWLLCRPYPAVTNLGLFSTSDVITFDTLTKIGIIYTQLLRRKRSLRWCPDQSDWPNGARDMHKNAQRVGWKTQSKISCHYTWLLHAKNCPSRWRFLRSFLTASKVYQVEKKIATRRNKLTKHYGKWEKLLLHFSLDMIEAACMRTSMYCLRQFFYRALLFVMVIIYI